MDEDIPEEGIPEPDTLGRFTIDERFNFALPDGEPQNEGEAGQALPKSETVPGTPGEVHDTMPLEPGSDDDTDAMIGQTIGNYEVIGRIGCGGFGTVYKARDTKLQRFAALKFLRFPLDSEYRKLFAREAQVIANLGKHPSIVQIYSWGEHLGSYYFALEYLDTSAEGLLEKSGVPLPVKRALEIAAECACALHFAHEEGVLHRDVKPANILIDAKSGHAKMCDFGLAKIQAFGAGTATSTIAGSPPYMAPEQIAGKTMDGRTDVYSLGVTLYELLSKKLPCTGSSHVDILEQIRKRKSTPLRKFRPDLSDSILEIVQRATAFRPEDRYETAEEMQEAIEAVLRSLERTGGSEDVSAGGKRRAWKGRRRAGVKTAAGALVAAVIVVIAVAGLGWLRGPDSDPQTSWPVAMADAKDEIEEGKYEEAIARLEVYVLDHPSEDFAHYALGYARVLTNQLREAEDAFGEVSDVGLRDEGMAAVQHAQLGEESRAFLQAAVEHVPTDYPELLIASLDLRNKEYAKAIKLLEAIDRAAFHFAWQQRRHGELIARAYYHGKDYEKADALFGAGTGASDRISESVNELYAKRTKQELDEDRHAAIAEQIARVKQLADRIKENKSANEDDDSSDWTSRPFHIRIEPATSLNSRLAEETGLLGVFPDLLADSLVNNDEVPIVLVDRDYIGDVLYEQQLSELSKEGVDAVELQKLLGAHLMIKSEFKAFMGDDFVWIKIIDTETSVFTGAESASFNRRTNAREWARQLGIQVRKAIQKEYPIQGILTGASGGPEINVGENVGVRAGMKFAVYSEPGLEHRLEKVNAVTLDDVGYDKTSVRLEAPAGIGIPNQGWYVRQIQE